MDGIKGQIRHPKSREMPYQIWIDEGKEESELLVISLDENNPPYSEVMILVEITNSQEVQITIETPENGRTIVVKV